MVADLFAVFTPAQQAKALAKSDEQTAAGNRPRLIRKEPDRLVFTVSSRTTGGQVYLVQYLPDGALVCDCQAIGACWHRMHVYRSLCDDIMHVDLTTGRPDTRYFDLGHHKGYRPPA